LMIRMTPCQSGNGAARRHGPPKAHLPATKRCRSAVGDHNMPLIINAIDRSAIVKGKRDGL